MVYLTTALHIAPSNSMMAYPTSAFDKRKTVVDYPEGPMNTSSTHHLSRSAKIALSWLAVVAMAAVIFWMSANTGESINSGLGIISAIKGALSAGAQWVFGHEVDVSPVGHFTEYLIFGATLFNVLRFHLSPASRFLQHSPLGASTV